MIFNNARTKLKEGDLIALNPETRIVCFFRGKQGLLFSSGAASMLFPWGEIAFGELIILLSNTHNFKSSPLETKNIEFSLIKIDDKKWISYRF